MKKYESTILNALLDQYERSKSFVGKNKQNQSFRKKIEDLFPAYADEAQYAVFAGVNEEVLLLEQAGILTVKRRKRGRIETEVIASVSLNVEKRGDAYRLLGRQPKADRNEEILHLLNRYREETPLLHRFCEAQEDRMRSNRKPLYADDLGKLEQILKVLAEVEKVEEEVYIRNFSVRVLGDSKAFEKIRMAVASILCEYGEYTDREHVLENLNIVKNPGYVYVKGGGRMTIAGQEIDISALNGELELSSELLEQIEEIEVSASKVITIENLTTFHSFVDRDAFMIYLGGYHNHIRRTLIRKIYEQNADKGYYHYGDIDAGGFHILLDLRARTGISFLPLHMDIATLEKYRAFTKKLTENDQNRLRNLLGGEFDAVVSYMLKYHCKLEQEAVECE